MSLEAWFTLAVIVVLVAVLAREVISPAVAVLSATILLLLVGIIDSGEAFAGFSNEAPIVVGALLVFARAADVSGVVGPVLERFFGRPDGTSQRWALPRLLAPAGPMRELRLERVDRVPPAESVLAERLRAMGFRPTYRSWLLRPTLATRR